MTKRGRGRGADPIHIGEYNVLEVVEETDSGLYLGSADESVLIPWTYVPEGTTVGGWLRVFVYTDSEDRPIATTLTPKAVVGDFAYLEVIDTSPHGVFLDWGLAKDLFAPANELHDRVRVGDRRVFAVSLDRRTGRVKASSKLRSHFDEDVSGLAPGDEVELLVYGRNDVGALVVVDGRHAGLVYHSEAFRPLRVGDSLPGYVKLVRPDGKVDIRLQRAGAAGHDDAQAVVLEALQARGGRLPLHDKSSPQAIRDALGLSKKAFKRAVGGLYKARRVVLGPEGIRLVDTPP